MLQSLHIVNFAIIEDTVIEVSDKTTVFTGETGSGKSILVDALAILTGRRARTDLIRTGADFFQVEGIFYADSEINALLSELGFNSDDKEIILTRKLNRSGRGVCTINGNFCTVRQLETVGRKLVRLHEQNDTFELLSAEYCETVVDNSSSPIQNLRHEYKEIYKKWEQLKNTIDDFDSRKQENERRLDILEWELQQIHDAEITEGEDEEIEERLTVLQNHERIINSLHDALSLLTREGTVQDELAMASKQVFSAAKYDKNIEKIGESINSAVYTIEDVVGELESYVADSDFSEEELATLQSRSETLLELKRKFGPALSDVIAYEKKAEEEYNYLKDMIYENSHMRNRLKELEKQVMEKAKKLNELRLSSGNDLIKRIVSVIHDLGMENAAMSLHLVPSTVPTPTGKEEMEIYFSANVGEPLRSMRETASGGEVSRIALAVEIVTADLLKHQTMVFDEIDVGISGKVGLQVAKKIKELARSIQVLVITHLPQTASIADKHYKIEKIISRGQTSSKAVLLNEKEHIENVAQMISGTATSISAIQAALEMDKLINN